VLRPPARLFLHERPLRWGAANEPHPKCRSVDPHLPEFKYGSEPIRDAYRRLRFRLVLRQNPVVADFHNLVHCFSFLGSTQQIGKRREILGQTSKKFGSDTCFIGLTRLAPIYWCLTRTFPTCWAKPFF
jgi:hypothetical protein